MYVSKIERLSWLHEIYTSWSIVVLSSGTDPCDGEVSPPVTDLIRLIDQLQASGVALALPGAALGYTVSGLLWLSGYPPWQRTARRLFFDVTAGLIIVLLAGSFVEMIRTALCGGGS